MPTLWLMPFPRKLLNSFEEVAIDLHPHWLYFAQPVLALAGAFVVTIVVKLVLPIDGGTPEDVLTLLCVVGILAAAGWLGVRYLKWVTTNFVVTTDRVIFREGVISKRGVEIPLERVNNVNFSQTIFERLTGSGDLTIESAGKDGASRFADVRQPEQVQLLIHAQIEQNENRKYDRMKPGASNLPPPAPAPAANDVLAQLDKLEDLRQRGVLTQAEFDAQKAKLLGN